MKVLKWIGLALAGLLVVVLIAGTGIYLRTEGIRNTKAAVDVPDFEVVASEELIARGRKLIYTRGCVDCHDTDLGGKTVIDDPAIGRVAGSNLTSGHGGAAALYRTNADWARAIRYGVNPEGRILVFMPSHEFNALNKRDTSALIAAIKAAPPVDRELAPMKVGPVARVLHTLGEMPILFPYTLVDLSKQPMEVEPSASAEYGQYLASSCIGCHGDNLKGGKIKGVPPDWPHALDITSTGHIPTWTIEQFKTVLRTGMTPDGRTLRAPYMPWPGTAKLEDQELEALYAFLKSKP